MKTTECPKCQSAIKNCNFKKHTNSCNGSYKPFQKLTHCPHCLIPLDEIVTAHRANHVRWCTNNPIRDEYISSLRERSSSNLGYKQSEQTRKKISDAWKQGKYDHINHSHPGWNHTLETKEHLRNKALQSPHRRLVRSIRIYTKKDGSTVQLDSKWEEVLATRLDELNVNWTRPDPIRWIDKNNVERNYFPDFYLEDYNLYLDPKNPYAIKAQQEKISCLLEQMTNLIILTSIEECRTFVPE